MTKQSRTASIAAVCATLTVGLFGCGGDGGSSESPADNFASAIDGIREAAEEMASGERVDPVDFRELKGLLPEEVAGLPRVSHEGERAGAAGFVLSTAEARYEAEEGPGSIKISVTDTGGFGGLATMGMAAWLSLDVDRETDRGYERTTKYEGYPAYEEFESRDGDLGSAELSFIVGERFIVQLDGRNVRMDDVKDAADDLPIGRLEDLSGR
jgi:hypothetical protein